MPYIVSGYGEDDGEYNSKEDYEAQMYRKKLAKRRKRTTKQPGFYMSPSAVNPYSMTNEEGDVTIPESSIQGCGPGCNTVTKSGSFIHGSGSCCTGQ
jgi:hypothetical protein